MTFNHADEAGNNFVVSNVSNCKHYDPQYFDDIQIYVHVLFCFLNRNERLLLTS